MIDRTHARSIRRQCQTLALSRSTAYDQPKPVSSENLALRRRIDELPLEHPFAGARLLRDLLRRDGHTGGRKHVATLRARLGLEALSRKPHTSQRHPAHAVYPYLLRHLNIIRSNHVWAADSTDIPMRRGFVYLLAVLDWASRNVGAWRVSNTLTTDFWNEAGQEARATYGTPAIFNTAPGCQFTSLDFTGLRKDHGIQISRDGTGCWRDNVFVERRGKSVNYEDVYLSAYDSGSVAQQGLVRYLSFYNQRRPHSALDRNTPDEGYDENLPRLQHAV